MRNIAQKIMIIGLVVSTSCNTGNEKIKLQTGDLLFRETVSGKLSKAIDQVTQTDSATHFSHLGIVELIDEEPLVLHASPEEGTCMVSLAKFSHPKGDSARIVVYRLKNQFQHTIPSAIAKAKSMLGKPYNFSYILIDSAHYCSEFIFRAFEADSIFELNPMTFKDPETNEFLNTWIDYYQELSLEIPEGFPGCNPNGMAASDKLICLGVLQE